MKQKIIRIGNSGGVTISKPLMEESGVKIGTYVEMSYKADMDRIVIDVPSKRTQTKIPVDPEVYTVANDLLNRYLPAFKKLARVGQDDQISLD
ncbi:hypothetical protein A2875_05455 [Candidatus Gottesmanbacteria bacterium RIFCSPHIGHO2_01_FULL_46_14]|uniref:SpoVT-AbrB domain-containing protein n=2 Tax=Candidatus Gottesmaniibacteriota TaxID=1752720 RepID=A0A1F5ZJH0_9BACT|nr:MAG: hypothetical protein A2875_05455 [Candidatus Gottesmanbacteria bacterium RIFCSPHIGHO2_01_FULL_46_14]OGG28596.1 MAG: hypothetical protein A2971_01750 [Candidatus Gottesmanbacteria bacterium RIFCSPLOWO2_01_FULL_46_21]